RRFCHSSPTRRSSDLVHTALQGLETTLTDGLAFDPASASRVFTLAARDVMEATALPVLMQQLQQQAPDVQLRSIRVPRRDIAAADRKSTRLNSSHVKI